MNIITSDSISIHGVAISMIGGRPENQDDMTFLDTPLGFLIIVCDGMGGGPGGKTASYITKQTIAETICSCTPQTSRQHALKMAIARANQALEEKMASTPALNGMGSTVVALLINSYSAVLAYAGDSRCYKLRGKRCVYRSLDHSLVAELISKKVMTEEEARQSPQSNIITRGLGSPSNHVPEIVEMPYRRGERFVLCTDGVWGSMPHSQLIEAFSRTVDQQQLLSDLSSQIDSIGVTKGGGHDNYTIALFDMENDSRMPTKPLWRKWAFISSVSVLITLLAGFFLWALLHKKEPKNHFAYEPTIVVKEASPIGELGTTVFEQEEPDEENGQEDADMLKEDSLTDGLLLTQLKEQISEKKGKTDSTANQKTQQPPSKQSTSDAQVTIQRIINAYNDAKVVRKNSQQEAAKFVSGQKKKILELFKTLSSQLKTQSLLRDAEAIKKAVDNQSSWYIGQPDSKKKYGLTARSKEYIDRQTKRLKELKNKTGKEKK